MYQVLSYILKPKYLNFESFIVYFKHINILDQKIFFSIYDIIAACAFRYMKMLA